MPNFTSDHLLLHYFGELDALSASSMDDLLSVTPALQEEYTQLSADLRDLKHFSLQPSAGSTDNILRRLKQDSGVHLV